MLPANAQGAASGFLSPPGQYPPCSEVSGSWHPQGRCAHPAVSSEANPVSPQCVDALQDCALIASRSLISS